MRRHALIKQLLAMEALGPTMGGVCELFASVRDIDDVVGVVDGTEAV
ncbi:hypothetical protein [Streptomyces sp. NBC_01431]|nr:hypothetical protein [Streptomyces sp. NBC_01431]